MFLLVLVLFFVFGSLVWIDIYLLIFLLYEVGLCSEKNIEL